MDDTLQELENELKRLTPRRPSAGLVQALERELAPEVGASPEPRYSPATSWRAWKWAGWPLAGVAAAVAVALAFFLQADRQPVSSPASITAATQPVVAPKPAETPVNRYQPVRASSVLYDLQEDGTAYLPDRTEGRQVRYRYVDTYTWKNPATNASLRWSVPRDEVRLVRASLD